MSRAALVAALALACSDPGPAGPRLRFDLPEGAAAEIPMADVPYPNDLLRGADGHIRVSAAHLPFGRGADEEVVGGVAAALARQTGFGVTTGVLFPIADLPFGEEIDPASLGEAIATLVDLGDGSTVPVVTSARVYDDLLHVAPRPGHVLREGRTYACLVRTGVRTAAGAALAADPDLTAALRPGARGRAAEVYAPLAAWLEAEGIDPGAVLGATVFTTASYRDTMVAARALVQQGAPPAAVIDHVYQGAALDDFLGVPTTKLWPGADNDEGVIHGHVAAMVLGHFAGVDFLNAAENVIGVWETDEDGAPIARGTEEVPFLLALPAGLSSWRDVPVVVMQHGINGSRETVAYVAETLAAHGIATIGIDIPFHGDRCPEAGDSRHNYTRAAGADGLADDSSPMPSLYAFAMRGHDKGGVARMDPSAMASTFRQAAVDLMSLARLLDEGDWSALDGDLAGLSFRGDRIVFAGHSFGVLMGATAVTYEPRFGAAVLSGGAGGFIFPLLEHSPVYWPFFGVMGAGAMDVDVGRVNWSPDPPHSHPAFLLLQQLIEPGDPLAHAVHAIRDPIEAPRHILAFGSEIDESVSPHGNAALSAALGLEWVTIARSHTMPTTIDPLPANAAPVSGNVAAAGGSVTAGYIVFSAACHGVIQQRFETQKFAPDFPPFDQLADPIVRDNPILEAQEILAHWAQSYVATGVPEIIEPVVQ